MSKYPRNSWDFSTLPNELIIWRWSNFLGFLPLMGPMSDNSNPRKFVASSPNVRTDATSLSNFPMKFHDRLPFDYVKMSKFLIRICQRFQRRSPIKTAELQHGPQRAGVEHGGLKAPATDRGTKRGQTDRQDRPPPNPTKKNPKKKE